MDERPTRMVAEALIMPPNLRFCGVHSTSLPSGMTSTHVMATPIGTVPTVTVATTVLVEILMTLTALDP